MVEDRKAPDGYKITEIGAIPEDWDFVRIGDLGNFSKGAGIRKDQANSGHIPCIRYGELYTKHNDIVRNYYSFISRDIAETSRKLKAGDVLFAGSGETKEEIGKCAAFIDETEVYAGGDIIIFSPVKGISEFYGYLLNAPFSIKQKASKGQGDAIVHISSSNLADIVIPFPIEIEQKAIAEALSDTDNLISSLEKLIDKKKKIKQGAMQQLLTGKKRLPGFSGEWRKVKVSDIGYAYGGLSGKSKSDFDGGNKPYITFLNVMNNTIIEINSLRYVRIKASESQNRVNTGDLLFNTSSETPEEVGMCSVLLGRIEELYLNSFCFGFRIYDQNLFDPLYLAYFFRSNEGRKLFFSLAQGATRYNLSKNLFYKIEFKHPSIQEQKAIAQVLSDMDAEIEALEEKLEKVKTIKQGMMQELLTGRIRLI